MLELKPGEEKAKEGILEKYDINPLAYSFTVVMFWFFSVWIIKYLFDPAIWPVFLLPVIVVGVPIFVYWLFRFLIKYC